MTRNPAYLIVWLRAGRPRLAGRSNSVVTPARGLRSGGAGSAGRDLRSSPVGDAQPVACRLPPGALNLPDYPALDVTTLT